MTATQRPAPAKQAEGVVCYRRDKSAPSRRTGGAKTVSEVAMLALLRKVCLGLPEVRETVKWGHPTFEAGKKMFAVLDKYGGRPCIALRVSDDQREALSADDRFFDAPYAGGWVCVRGRIGRGELTSRLLASYRLVALKRMLAALDAR
jgi:predicted DNA-binding protein (MmcQ/YjbR family)